MHTHVRFATLAAVAALLTGCNEGLLVAGHIASLGLSCAMLVATLNMDKVRRR
jgi:hypothetical protein